METGRVGWGVRRGQGGLVGGGGRGTRLRTNAAERSSKLTGMVKENVKLDRPPSGMMIWSTLLAPHWMSGSEPFLG